MASESVASVGTRSRLNNTILAAVALAASATMWFLGTGLHPWWWLTWFAPLPVLLVASRVGAWAAFTVAVLAWLIGSLNMWHYMVGVLETPIGIVLIFLIVPGCLFGLTVLLFPRFIRRGALWKASLAFPAAWVTCEYLNYVTSPHGTFPYPSGQGTLKGLVAWEPKEVPHGSTFRRGQAKSLARTDSSLAAVANDRPCILSVQLRQ